MRILMLIFLALSVSLPVFAEDDDFWESRSSRKSSKRSGSSKIAVGLSSNAQLLQDSETAISALFDINRKSGIQGYFKLTSSDPNLYAVGATYKYIISGKKKLGFHVGGGIGIGSYLNGNDDESFTRLMGLAGFRFTVQKKIQIHVDGGLTIKDDDPNDSQTTIQGNSTLFGLSMLYTL